VAFWELIVKDTPYLGKSSIASLSSLPLPCHSNIHEPVWVHELLGKIFRKSSIYYCYVLILSIIYKSLMSQHQ